jgi:calcineurin-like phosphoesterase
MKKEECIERFLFGTPTRLQTASGRALLSGVSFSLGESGHCTSLSKIYEIL